MSLSSLPEEVRVSHLVQSLTRKLEEPQPVAFDYIGELVRVVNQVRAEASQINRLFPEYTPHDAHYHLNRLFDVADRVIEKRRYMSFNAAELFVLAAALYSHDWGMAVSDGERAAVELWTETGKEPAGYDLLPFENDRVVEFAGRSGVSSSAALTDVSLWREYVRETHADRSARRIRVFFGKLGGGVADAVARVAWAHGVDFLELQRPNAFPTDFGVNGYSLNLRALAVYVRLTDLLDIADDRTPYAVWHFVAPRNPRSNLEWKKHRALNPVTFPAYQSGRKVLVDGSTSDPEVWASLRDLGRYVDDQIRGCNDLLATLGDSRYHLDLPLLDWRIHAEGFTAVDLRFEFHREQTFKILSEEIYDGDCYVFLRELLQNAIDAIRMRQELLQREGIVMEGLIRFEITYGADGDAIVRCHDNGIGMDDYIIRHYLAVAGRSFYTSDDFKRYGLTMDAISRFGVGILSCFMAADEISIETLRDPNLAGRREPLRIQIPEVTRQFRVYPGSGNAKSGTTVTVNVRGKYLSTAPEGWRERLRVADYLAGVAGFVEFPILVQSADQTVAIVHPDADESAIRRTVLPHTEKTGLAKLEVRKKAQSYPWEKMFAPQDVAIAKKYLRTEWFNVSDLWAASDVQPFEGRIGVLMPEDPKFHCYTGNYMTNDDYHELRILEQGQPRTMTHAIRTVMEWRGLYRTERPAPTPLSLVETFDTEIHYNGIAVRKEQSKPRYRSDVVPNPFYSVNVKKATMAVLNVARSKVRHGQSPWKEEIDARLHHKILERHTKDVLGMNAKDRFMFLGHLRAFYRIPITRFTSLLSPSEWPVAWFQPDHSFAFRDIQTDLPDTVPSITGRLLFHAAELLRIHLERPSYPYDRESLLAKWVGDACLCISEREDESTEDATAAALQIGRFALLNLRPAQKIRFVTGWRFEGDYIPQTVYTKEDSVFERDPEVLLRQFIREGNNLNPEQWRIVMSERLGTARGMHGELAVFEAPYEANFAFGRLAMNLAHPVVQTCLGYGLALRFHPRAKEIGSAAIGKLQDELESTWTSMQTYASYANGSITKDFEHIAEQFENAGFSMRLSTPPAPTLEDFVPGSVVETAEGSMFLWSPTHEDTSATRQFGHAML